MSRQLLRRYRAGLLVGSATIALSAGASWSKPAGPQPGADRCEQCRQNFREIKEALERRGGSAEDFLRLEEGTRDCFKLLCVPAIEAEKSKKALKGLADRFKLKRNPAPAGPSSPPSAAAPLSPSAQSSERDQCLVSAYQGQQQPVVMSMPNSLTRVVQFSFQTFCNTCASASLDRNISEPCTRSPFQLWSLTPLNDRAGAFLISNVGSGKCLAEVPGQMGSVQAACSARDPNQAFWLHPQLGYIAGSSGQCLSLVKEQPYLTMAPCGQPGNISRWGILY